jgi:hypothetical protein
MKKLIVLSVIFALVAGSVFAADVSVEVFGSTELLKGNDIKELKDVKDDGEKVYGNKNKNSDSFGIGRVRINASGATEDGTIGGSLRYDAGGGAAGWVWWKPVDAFKLQIGTNPDGEFGLDGVAGWGFHMLANEVLPGLNGHIWSTGKDGDGKYSYGGGYTGLDVKYRDAFFGGWGGAVMLTATPVEALTINIGLPLGTNDAAYKDYLKFTAQVTYNIDGVGTAGITYQNGFGHEDGGISTGEKVTTTWVGPSGEVFGGTTKPGATKPDGDKIGEIWTKTDVKTPTKGYSGDTNDPSKLFIYFGLSSIENLGIDVGVGLTLPSDVVHTEVWTVATDKKESEKTVTTNYPISAGLGVNFSSGALGVKARVLGVFGGSTETKEVTYKADGSEDTSKTDKVGDGLTMLIDVMPSFAVNENMTAYLSLGTGFKTGWDVVDKVEDGKNIYKPETSSLFAWHVHPYVAITPNYWNGTFFAGFRLESPIEKYNTPDKEGNEVMNRILKWSIPVGITFSF